MPFVLVLCLGIVVCLGPVTGYILWLGQLARRSRPTVVAGVWDFAALLAGLSGFFLYGGGLLLSLIRSNVRYGIRGNFEALKQSFAEEGSTWALIVIAYVAIVIGAAAIEFFFRRRSLVIYNIEPATFEHTLSELFDHMGLKVERQGNTWFAGPPLLSLDPFEAGHTVRLRWETKNVLQRQEIERQLRQALPSVAVSENPSSWWFTSVAITLVILVVVNFVLLMFGLPVIR